MYAEDSDLFKRGNYEVTISTKLAQYLFIEFKNFDVDCEYNKHVDGEKYSTELNKNIRPDIIIHERGNDSNNLLCIEIKKENKSKKRGDKDFSKLKSLTKQDGKYKYQLGVYINFTIDKNKLEIKYFKNGVESQN
jgi:hypothetical protein